MKSLLHILLTMLLSTSLFGFWGQEKYEVTDDVFVLSAKDVNSFINNDNKSAIEEKIFSTLRQFNVIAKKDSIYILSQLDGGIKDGVSPFAMQFMESYFLDNNTLAIHLYLTQDLTTKASFLVYYDLSTYEFKKLVYFDKEVWRLIPSFNDQYLFVESDVKESSTSKIYETKEFTLVIDIAKCYDVKNTHDTSWRYRFSKDSNYFMYTTSLRSGYFEKIIYSLKDLKQVFYEKLPKGDRTSENPFIISLSDDSKYKMIDGLVSYIDSNKILSQIESSTIPSSWNADSVFFAKLSNKTTLFNLNSKKKCSLPYEPYSIEWIKNSNQFYTFEKNGKLSLYLMMEENCELLESKKTGFEIVWNEKVKISMQKFQYINKNLIFLYENFKNGDFLKIKKIGIKRWSDKKIAKFINKKKHDAEIKKDFDKAKKLIDAGFEKRGLKLLDKLVSENYEWNTISGFNAKKYKWAYSAYLAAKHFNKRLNNSQEIDFKLLVDYRAFAAYAAWYRYEYLIAEPMKRFKQAYKTKKLFDKKLIDEQMALIEATYLLSIGKDDEAYNLLFDNQPFSDKSKVIIKGYTFCSNSLTKDMNKLSVAVDMPLEKLNDPVDCVKLDGYPFFFDIDGNKVFRDAQKNKLEPKKVETKEEEAIELLD